MQAVSAPGEFDRKNAAFIVKGEEAEIIPAILHDEHVLDIRGRWILLIGAQDDLFVAPMNAVLAFGPGLDAFAGPITGERTAAAIVAPLLIGAKQEPAFLDFCGTVGEK